MRIDYNALDNLMSSRKLGVRGVSYLLIDDEDIEAYLPKEMFEKYERLEDEKRTRFCAFLADEMMAMLEESPDWGFGRLMKETLDVDTGELEEALE